jgi:cephalosporin hydroxylase
MPGLIARLRRRVRRLRRQIVGTPLRVGSYRAPRALRPLTADEIATTNAFHELYYDIWEMGRDTGRGTISLSWLGYRTLKSPVDLWTYQEILVETRPDLVIETGTRFGGSACYLAAIMELIGHGRVVSIDINAEKDRPTHPRIEYLLGSSIDETLVARVRSMAAGKRVMVILDADHSEPHVSAEIAAYHDLVAIGCYLVVEDGNVNGHPVLPDWGPGPMEAVDRFLEGRDDFVVDADRERFLLTLNPRGYLRRVR